MYAERLGIILTRRKDAGGERRPSRSRDRLPPDCGVTVIYCKTDYAFVRVLGADTNGNLVLVTLYERKFIAAVMHDLEVPCRCGQARIDQLNAQHLVGRIVRVFNELRRRSSVLKPMHSI